MKHMVVTPMSTLVNAVAGFVEDPKLSGQIGEVHGDKVTLAQPQPYVDADSKANIEMFWTLGYA